MANRRCRTIDVGKVAGQELGGQTQPTKFCSGEGGWTARLLGANEPHADSQRLRDGDRFRSDLRARQDPERVHSGSGRWRASARAVLASRLVPRVPVCVVSVVRRKSYHRIGSADRKGKRLAAGGHEADRNERAKHERDQQHARNELAPTSIEQAWPHVPGVPLFFVQPVYPLRGAVANRVRTRSRTLCQFIAARTRIPARVSWSIPSRLVVTESQSSSLKWHRAGGHFDG
jgi:hypothetical protein